MGMGMLYYTTWRFMGSYKWGYKEVITHIKGHRTLLITTHEPPSRV